MRKASVFALMLGIMLPSLAGAYTTNTLRPAGIKTRIEFDTNQDGTTVTLNENGVTLSDAAGADSWAWYDSAGVEVGSIDSDGDMMTTGDMTVGAGNFRAGGIGGMTFVGSDLTVLFSVSDTSNMDVVGYVHAATTLQAGTEVRHLDDADTAMVFEPDQIGLKAGGVTFVEMTETTQDIFEINPGGVDIDTKIQGAGEPYALFVDAATDRVAIGTDDVTTYVARMVVDAAAGASPGYAAAFINGDNEADAYGIMIEAGRYTIQSSDQWIHLADRTGGLKGGVEWDGTDPAFFTSSDKKFKTNVRDSIRDAVAAVRQVRPRDFERNGETVRGGFTAQELETCMPDAVSTRTFTVKRKQPNGSIIEVEKTGMFVNLGIVDRYYRHAVTVMAQRQKLQRQQINWFRNEATRRGWDMSSFPLH